MERYDIAIIGTGPAGVSAAITAKVRNKSVLLLGSADLSAKLTKTQRILNYPGFPDTSGEKLAQNLKTHLDSMEIAVTAQRANGVYAMGDYFAVQTAQQMYEAKSVILASGMAQDSVLEGEQELLGRGVSYCVTCDAQFYRNKTAAIVSYQQEAEAEADYLAEIAEKVYYFPIYKEEVAVSEAVRVIREKPLAVEAAQAAEAVAAQAEKNAMGQQEAGAAELTATSVPPRVKALRTENGCYEVDGVFIAKESMPAQQLVPGLSMNGKHVAVNAQMETNIPGCFACGDITGTPYQYIKAAGEGNVAALSAVAYLARQKRV